MGNIKLTSCFNLIAIWLFVPSLAENLELIVTNAKLPKPAYRISAVYDGQDSVFIIGGYGTTGAINQVVKYSLDSDRVTAVGTFTPTYAGQAVMTNSEEILYYGGYGTTASNQIYSYSTVHGNYSAVATLPTPMCCSSLAWDSDNQIVYLFGGYNGAQYLNSVLRHNVNTNQVDHVGTLPVALYESTAVWDSNNGVAYTFGGEDNAGSHFRKILQFDPTQQENNVTTLPVTLPYYLFYPCSVVVSTQNCAYVSGDSPLLRFDTTTHTVETLQVEGWPAIFDGAACAYVPRLGRVYIFGGKGSWSGEEIRYRDEISYVQVDTMETTGTPPPQQASTAQPEPGPCPPIGYEVFTHESNCSKYYECNDGVAYEFECPTNTYFDINQEIRRCNRAELALCNAECPATGVEFLPIRASGCKWYKVCIEGHSTNLECGGGTIYDPQPQRCVPDEEYTCPYLLTF